MLLRIQSSQFCQVFSTPKTRPAFRSSTIGCMQSFKKPLNEFSASQNALKHIYKVFNF